MSGPIRPDSVGEKQIPTMVFDVFNELIVREFEGERATIKQDEVVAILVQRGFSRADIFAEHHLDVETAYRRAGWRVNYSKPGFNEDGPATFTFERLTKEGHS